MYRAKRAQITFYMNNCWLVVSIKSERQFHANVKNWEIAVTSPLSRSKLTPLMKSLVPTNISRSWSWLLTLKFQGSRNRFYTIFKSWLHTVFSTETILMTVFIQKMKSHGAMVLCQESLLMP